MEFDLEEMKTGVRAIVTSIPDDCSLKGRLREFGFIAGTQFECLFMSPGGHLAALAFGGTTIAVRIADLQGITARRC